MRVTCLFRECPYTYFLGLRRTHNHIDGSKTYYGWKKFDLYRVEEETR